MRLYLFILFLICFTSVQSQEKHKIPVYVFTVKEKMKDSLVLLLKDSLQKAGFKVVDEAEHDRLMKTHFERMFKMSEEARERGNELDPATLNKRLPVSYQNISLDFTADPATHIITTLIVRVHLFPPKEKIIPYEFRPNELTGITTEQLVVKLLGICLERLQ